MKICYFSCSSIYGGVEKIVVDSLNEISKNHECALIVPNGCRYKDKLSSNVKIIEYKSYDKRYNPFLYLEVLKVIKNYDIVHTHGAKATQITYLLNKIILFIHVATKHNTRKGKIFNKVNNVISVFIYLKWKFKFGLFIIHTYMHTCQIHTDFEIDWLYSRFNLGSFSLRFSHVTFFIIFNEYIYIYIFIY